MGKRIGVFVCLLLLGLSLGGCTKCGWVWDDAFHACHGTPKPN